MCPLRHGLYDAMHVFFVGGVFNTHVGLLLKVITDFGMGRKVLSEFVAKFTAPKIFGFWTGDIFDAMRYANHTKEHTLKATTSECLSLMPMLASLMEDALVANLSPAMNRHAACFLQLVGVIESIWASCKHEVDTNGLRKGIERYLHRFKELFGESSMAPKFHFMIHVPSLIERFGWAPNCLA